MNFDPNTHSKVNNTARAAKKIGVGKSTMEKWRCKNIGPRYIQLSTNRVGYLDEDLEAYIQSRAREPVDNSSTTSSATETDQVAA